MNAWVCVIPAGPGKDQEELRRKVENGVRELWYFVRSEVKKLPQVETGALQKHVDTLLQDLGHQQRLYTYTYTHQRCTNTLIIFFLLYNCTFLVNEMHHGDRNCSISLLCF